MQPKIEVWWIPQIPLRDGNKPFTVEVPTLEEAVRLEETLALYDLYQFNTKIKPDYSNVGGVRIWDPEQNDWEEINTDDEYGLEEARELVARIEELVTS